MKQAAPFLWTLCLTAALALPSLAAEAPKPPISILAHVKELDKPVTYTERDLRLGVGDRFVQLLDVRQDRDGRLRRFGGQARQRQGGGQAEGPEERRCLLHRVPPSRGAVAEPSVGRARLE